MYLLKNYDRRDDETMTQSELSITLVQFWFMVRTHRVVTTSLSSATCQNIHHPLEHFLETPDVGRTVDKQPTHCYS